MVAGTFSDDRRRRRDFVWRLMFSAAIAVLMLMILLIRAQDTAVWVLVVYPLVGALLANVASRTSPRSDEIVWIETTTIAAACILVLAVLVNILIIERLLVQLLYAGVYDDTLFEKYAVVILQVISVLLWLALSRRLSRFRAAGDRRHAPEDE